MKNNVGVGASCARVVRGVRVYGVWMCGVRCVGGGAGCVGVLAWVCGRGCERGRGCGRVGVRVWVWVFFFLKKKSFSFFVFSF